MLQQLSTAWLGVEAFLNAHFAVIMMVMTFIAIARLEKIIERLGYLNRLTLHHHHAYSALNYGECHFEG